MDRAHPWSALLSQALVAFTIEFDNEFEHLVPHLTTNHGPAEASRDLPWVVSMTMWLQFMRWVPEDGIPAKELCGLVLLAFALEFERDSKISLALGANLLRLVADDGIRVRDLPQMAGVSNQAIAMALCRAQECGFGAVRQKPPSRTKFFVLSAKGRKTRDTYNRLVWEIEENWKAAFGRQNVRRLREGLEQLIDSADFERSLLLQGLKPHEDGWRRSVPAPERLPHYPMVLHRGGFPDGS